MVRESRRQSAQPEWQQRRRLFLAVVGGTGSLPAGHEPPAAAGGLRGVRVVFRSVLRTVGAVRATAANLRPQVRAALVARVAVRHSGRGGPARPEQTGHRTAHVPGVRRIPMRPRRDSIRGAEPPQHRADGPGSRPAGRRHRGLRGVAAARRQRRDPLPGGDGGLGH